MKRNIRQYTPEIKKIIINECKTTDYRVVAKRYGVPKSTIFGWLYPEGIKNPQLQTNYIKNMSDGMYNSIIAMDKKIDLILERLTNSSAGNLNETN